MFNIMPVLQRFVLPFLVFSILIPPSCQPEIQNADVATTSPVVSGHQRMVAMLDSIAQNAKPEDCYNLNSKKAELAKKKLEAPGLTVAEQVPIRYTYAKQLLYSGKTDAAIMELSELIKQMGGRFNHQTKPAIELLALCYLRMGEEQNCISTHTSQSCLLPLKEGGIYKMKAGPQTAIRIYTDILNAFPDDLQARWLLNMAYMAVGEYPDGVPAKWRVPEEIFQSSGKLRFEDIGISSGLDVLGLSGGICMEDFDADGDLDLFMTSYGLADQVKYFTNNGDGTFSDRTVEANLTGIVSGLNTVHADYDNDGDHDILILRGGWLTGGTHPNSLLRNNGDQSGLGVTFTDVTIEAGLLSFHPTQTASWADFNGDGWLDLYIANESFPPKALHPNELYKNNGDGTFTNVARSMKVDLLDYFKGCIWGDINNDRLPDLYLTSLIGDNLLLVNRGGSQFENIAPKTGTVHPKTSFPTWIMDYNNDGLNDIFVVGYGLAEDEGVAGDLLQSYLGDTPEGDWFRVYKNEGNEQFSDVTKELGLDKLTFAMGMNFGDLDNDGWIDFYLGTGKPDFRAMVPNRMFRNINGERFEEVTMDGFAHVQKGHGIAFGDLDNDGDQDIYQVVGGAFEGAIAHNVLFENHGTKGRWVNIKLVGETCNRDAIGSKIAVHTTQSDGQKRTFWVTVNTGGSFGSASLQQEIGLGDAVGIEKVEVFWARPGPALTTYPNVPMERFVEIREGEKDITVLERRPIPF